MIELVLQPSSLRDKGIVYCEIISGHPIWIYFFRSISYLIVNRFCEPSLDALMQ